MMTAYSTTAKRATTAIPAPTVPLALAPRLRPAGRALKVSQRSQLPPFLALDVLRTASELQAAGQDIVHLEIGQPSTSAPQQVNGYSVLDKLVCLGLHRPYRPYRGAVLALL